MLQLDAFGPPPTPRRREARLKRDLGMIRAELSQERASHDWNLQAAMYLREYARRIAQGQPFKIEDAREASASRVPVPKNQKSWGPAVMFAARQKWIKRAEGPDGRPMYDRARSSNLSPKPLWVAGE
ncbi:MAG TPA: hypothetical protein PLX85_00125 [Dehalococcoidia bacterium]|nr:hypothetical protein [Dehalococcoidia bacterium]